MINLLQIVQPIAIIFALVSAYLAISHGVDLFNAIFRGVVVYAITVLLVLIVNYFYLMMVRRVKESESRRIRKIAEETSAEIRKRKAKNSERQ